MAPPPLWKVKRELQRAGGQLARGVARFYEPAVDHLHLRGFSRRVVQAAGVVQASPKIAVFVLYQPSGIAGSTFLTCRHLISNGYSPLVISNAPLQCEDRGRLAEVAWRVVERPNHGYDFGAYRDGLLIVREAGLDPDVLVLMNDSTWFPLWSSDKTIEELDTRNAPFSGLSYKHEPRVRRGRPHMESHFLRFSREALGCADFRKFWEGYVASNSRVTTIERGEKGLTAAMQKAGFTPAARLSREALLVVADNASADELRCMLDQSLLTRTQDRTRVDLLLDAFDGSEGWSTEARALISELSDSFANILSSAFVFAAARHIGLPFVKKSSEIRFVLARRKIVELERSGDLDPLEASVAAEISGATSHGGDPPSDARGQ